ncbi:MAG: hypothetical protein R3C11_17365 [Planctomycetaceae bacterium]
MISPRIRFLILLLIAGPVLFFAGHVQGEEVRMSFDGPEKLWRARTNKKTQVDIYHENSNNILIEGKGSEHFEVMNRTPYPEQVDFYLDIPPARVIPDFSISVWFRSNRQMAASWIRITLPNQADPLEPDKPLQFYLAGEAYSKRENEWQMLTCKTDDKTINTRLQWLRREINYPQLNLTGMYVDQLYISCRIPQGPSEFFFDKLRMDPVVLSNDQTAIQPAGGTGGFANEEKWTLPVDFRLDRLTVQGRPFFPIMIPSHQESAAALALTGVNTVWVQDYRDYKYLQDLRREDLWATATPPYVPPPTGQTNQAFQASPAPFERETEPIIFWNLGARVPTSEHPMLIDWKQQIYRADQKALRPSMVDTLGEERTISRHFNMISSSRHTLHTSMSLARYRDLLEQKRRVARPGTFMSTWIQTEPTSRFLHSPVPQDYSLVIEPEQIRLQVYCALQAGVNALGYWTTTPLASDYPGSYERRLAITDINQEIALIEPWLAKGEIQPRIIPFETITAPQKTSSSLFSISGKLKSAEQVRTELKPEDPIIEGAIIKSEEFGSLLIAVCYNQYSQYVPAPLSAENVSIIIPSGVPETASAWLVTSTGLKSLDRERVAGGTMVTLPSIDMTALVVLTSNRNQVNQLEKRIAEHARKAAQTSLDLASAKLTRIENTIEELQRQGVSDQQRVSSMTRAPYILSKSRSLIDQAEQMLAQGQFHDSRLQSQSALRLVRSIQFNVWHETVFPRLTTPVSSPYTIAFSSLPAHWRMIEEIGRSNFDTQQNLLPLGNFETEQTVELIHAGWENIQESISGIKSGALLISDAQEGKYALRLAAMPAVGDPSSLPAYLDQAPIQFNTSRIPVKAGQLLYVSGLLKIPRPIQRADDGFMIYDTLGGEVRSLRWYDQQGWQRFSFLRKAETDTDFQISMELTGLGEVHVDDLRVIPITPRQPALNLEQVDGVQQPAPGSPLARPLRYLNSLPQKLNPFKKRENEP